MLLSQLVKMLNYDFVGEDVNVNSIKYCNEADETDIAVCRDKGELQKTMAKVVLIPREIIRTNKILIFPYDNLNCAIAKVCKLLVEKGYYQDYSYPVKYSLHDGGYYIGKGCMISKSAIIQPGAMIGNNVTVGDGTIIDSYSVIGSGTIIENNVQIKAGCKIATDSIFNYFGPADEVQEFKGCGIVKIKSNTYIGYNTIVQRGTISDTIIGKSCRVGNLVEIGHDVKIGNFCKIVSQTGIAGRAILKNNVLVFGQVGVNNDVTIGNNVIVKGKTLVNKSIADGQIVFGQYGRKFKEEMKLEAKLRQFFFKKDV